MGLNQQSKQNSWYTISLGTIYFFGTIWKSSKKTNFILKRLLWWVLVFTIDGHECVSVPTGVLFCHRMLTGENWNGYPNVTLQAQEQQTIIQKHTFISSNNNCYLTRNFSAPSQFALESPLRWGLLNNLVCFAKQFFQLLQILLIVWIAVVIFFNLHCLNQGAKCVPDGEFPPLRQGLQFWCSAYSLWISY